MFNRKITSKTITFLAMVLFPVILMADGLIVIPHPHHTPQPFPLEVKYHKVDVTIQDQMATTHIDQAFYNPTSFNLEGYYIFPIPKGAILKNFKMFVK